MESLAVVVTSVGRRCATSYALYVVVRTLDWSCDELTVGVLAFRKLTGSWVTLSELNLFTHQFERSGDAKVRDVWELLTVQASEWV